MKEILLKHGIDEKNLKFFENLISGEKFYANNSNISADVIKKILIIPELKEKITSKGLKISDARIENKLDLSFLKADFPICFDKTNFSESIDIRLSNIASLFITNSKIEDGIQLNGAKINGQLNFKGSHFEKKENEEEEKDAINAENTFVNGHAFLCDDRKGNKFYSKGQVNLANIKINGNLDCTEATFEAPNPKKDNISPPKALNFNFSKITGNVWLNEKFKAIGEVCFIGANIGGSLYCNDAKFYNLSGRAIHAKMIEVGKDVFLDKISNQLDSEENGFCAHGEVKFSGGKIAGQLRCEGAEFNEPCVKRSEYYNDPHAAFLAKGLKVKGPLFLTNLKVKGVIDLTDATINGRFELLNIKGSNEDDVFRIILKSAYAREFQDNIEKWPKKNAYIVTKHFKYDILNQKYFKSDIKTNIKHRIEKGFLPQEDSFFHQPYLQMAKVLKNEGFEKEAKWLKIKMNDTKRKSHIKNRIKAWLWIKKVLIGYGYKPVKALPWALGVWIIGVLIFSYGYSTHQIKPPSKFAWENTNPPYEKPYKYYPEFNPLIYSLDVFLPIVNLGQQEYWRPKSKNIVCLKWFRISTSWLLCYVDFEILFGWFLSSMLIIDVSGLIKQD